MEVSTQVNKPGMSLLIIFRFPLTGMLCVWWIRRVYAVLFCAVTEHRSRKQGKLSFRTKEINGGKPVSHFLGGNLTKFKILLG